MAWNGASPVGDVMPIPAQELPGPVTAIIIGRIAGSSVAADVSDGMVQQPPPVVTVSNRRSFRIICAREQPTCRELSQRQFFCRLRRSIREAYDSESRTRSEQDTSMSILQIRWYASSVHADSGLHFDRSHLRPNGGHMAKKAKKAKKTTAKKAKKKKK